MTASRSPSAPRQLGALSCNAAGACTYTPAANANGTDTVPYTVTDGSEITTGAIALTIVPINDAPTAPSMSLSTNEDTPVSFTLPAADVDAGDALTLTLTSSPAQGTVSGVAPNLTYSPAANANGLVSFGYRATDTAGASSTGTVSINVNPIDDAPVANSQAVTTPEDTAKAITLSGSDIEGPVSITITSPPVHGSYGSGTYSPAPNFNGTDAIGFRVTDGGGQTANGVIGITITPVNDPPAAFSASHVTTRTVAIPITLNASDPDGDTLAWAIVSAPSHGTLSGTAPDLTYTPAGLYSGPDAFTFKVTDPAGLTGAPPSRSPSPRARAWPPC